MNTSLAASTTSGLRRQISSALVTLSIAVGMVAVTSTPADAASYVLGCFLAARNTTPAHSLEGMPVRIEAYYNGVAYHVGTVKLAANHCADWVVPVNLRGYFLRMYLDFRINSATYQLHWRGWSPWLGKPGEDGYFLGANFAYCVTGCFMY